MIGDQHHLCSPGRRVPRERDDVLLVASDIENEHDVASPNVKQAVAPDADAGRNVPDVGPHKAEVRGEIASQGVSEPAAKEMHAAPPIA